MALRRPGVDGPALFAAVRAFIRCGVYAGDCRRGLCFDALTFPARFSRFTGARFLRAVLFLRRSAHEALSLLSRATTLITV